MREADSFGVLCCLLNASAGRAPGHTESGGLTIKQSVHQGVFDTFPRSSDRARFAHSGTF